MIRFAEEVAVRDREVIVPVERHAHARARDRFTVDRMVDGTQAVYASLFSAQRKVS